MLSVVEVYLASSHYLSFSNYDSCEPVLASVKGLGITQLKIPSLLQRKTILQNFWWEGWGGGGGEK